MGLGFLLGIGIGFIVGIGSTSLMIIASDVHDAAAWAQAIFNALALAGTAGAVFLVRKSERDDIQDDRTLKARALALGIESDIAAIMVRAMEMEIVVQRDAKQFPNEFRKHEGREREARRIVVPPGVARWYPDLYLAGRTGHDIITLIALCEQLDHVLSEPIEADGLQYYANQIIALCQKILPALKTILERKTRANGWICG